MAGRFTPTQQAIVNALADGMAHSRDQLQALLPDELAGRSALAKHICLIRKVINPIGQDIICEYRSRNLFYRHVRLLSFE